MSTPATSSTGAPSRSKKVKLPLPSSMFSVDGHITEASAAASKNFHRAKMPQAGDDMMPASGLNPKTRGEATKGIEDAVDSSIIYFSDPARLQMLGDQLRYLLPRYYDKGTEIAGTYPEAMENCKKKYHTTLTESDDHAVHTKLLLTIYNGAVARLEKAAKKTGNRDALKIGPNGEEVGTIGRVDGLEEAYKKATKRDPRYMWSLEVDENGKTKVVRRNSPTASDWMKQTGDGMRESKTTDEALGFLLGSTIRALVRLTPGIRDVEGNKDVRVHTAKLLNQIESLRQTHLEVKPHNQPSQAEAREDTPPLARGAGTEGRIFGSDGKPAKKDARGEVI